MCPYFLLFCLYFFWIHTWRNDILFQMAFAHVGIWETNPVVFKIIFMDIYLIPYTQLLFWNSFYNKVMHCLGNVFLINWFTKLYINGTCTFTSSTPLVPLGQGLCLSSALPRILLCSQETLWQQSCLCHQNRTEPGHVFPCALWWMKGGVMGPRQPLFTPSQLLNWCLPIDFLSLSLPEKFCLRACMWETHEHVSCLDSWLVFVIQ